MQKEKIGDYDLCNIYNLDTINAIKDIPDDSVDLIVTDPPYRITTRGNSGGTGGMLATMQSKKGKIFLHNDIDIDDWIVQAYRVLKPQSHIYIMCNNKNLLHYLQSINKAGFIIFKTLIWDKQNKICNMYYMDSHEYIIFGRKGKAKKINNNGCSSILRYKNVKTKIDKKNIHDSEKPLGLMKELILNSSNKWDIVLDPFLGSGTTCIAAKETGRRYIGFEIDCVYYDIAKNRLNGVNMQGQTSMFTNFDKLNASRGLT